MTEPPPTQAKQTPGRRKPGAGGRRSNRKNYASETDVGRADPNFKPDFVQRLNKNQNGGGGGPKTPQKSQQNAAQQTKSPAPGSQPVSGKNTGRNSRSQQANAAASPAPAKTGRRTPPHTAGPKAAGAAPPSASAAFAGATFHASPAPSSLPLPSFFTKTNSPGTPRARPASGLGQQPSPPASDPELYETTSAGKSLPSAGPNPLFPASGARIAPSRDESPLDLLFRADRVEKERNRRASSANIYSAPVEPFSPPLQTQALADSANSHTFPRDGSQQQFAQSHQAARRPGPTLRTSSSGISAAELDGTPGRPIGPAFATPFQDRIRAARPMDTKGPSSAGLPSGFRDLAAGTAPPPFAGALNGQQPVTPVVDDRSEALKRFLFSKTGANAASSATPFASAPTTPTRNPIMGYGGGTPQTSGYGPHYQNTYSAVPVSGTPNGPNHPGNSAQATPSRPGQGGGPNIAAMEDSLRQILKLDSPFGSRA